MAWTDSQKLILPISLAIIIAIAIFLGFLLKNKKEKVKAIPFIVISSILLILEIIKQIREISDGNYSNWAIPLHFCSTFLYWFPLASFFKGKTSSFGKSLGFVASGMMTLLFYVNPGSIIGDSTDNIFASFSEFHTFFYHHLVILYFSLNLSISFYKPKKRDVFNIFLGLTCYFSIAVFFAFLLNVNFTAILESPMDFLTNWRNFLGDPIYILGMYIFGLIFAFIIWFLYSILINFIEKKKLKTQRSKINKQFQRNS